MRYFVLIISVLAFTNVQAQQNFNDAELNTISENIGYDYILANQSRNIIGDPYFNIKWLKGIVQIDDNVKTGELLLRYNTERNIVEFQKGDKYYGINPARINGFVFYAQPRNIAFRNGFYSEDHDIDRSKLMRVVYDGKVKLIAHHTTSLKENVATYGSAQQKDEYVDDINYYLIIDSDNYVETRLRRRSILKDLNTDKDKEIRNFAEDNDLDFDEESDLIKILKYYDQLSS